ncbi:MAG: glycogen debranching N-terminal domain-containing protein, partial [Streptomyces sp.]
MPLPAPSPGSGVSGVSAVSGVSGREGSRRPAPRSPLPPGGPAQAPAPRRLAQLPPAHATLICVAMPALAISTDQGQLTGRGLEGFYRAGRRLLSRCQLRVAGREPIAVQARMLSADCARFVATLRPSADGGPDPDVIVERTRYADGTERIVLRSAAGRHLRLPVEVSLGTDLAELGAVASGNTGPELPASVHDSGMRWSSPPGTCVVSAHPGPADALASAGLLRWEVELPPGGTWSLELRVRP